MKSYSVTQTERTPQKSILYRFYISQDATVDTTKKTLSFILAPEGETQKLSIDIGSYMTVTVDKQEYLILQKVQTNRVWLNRIFADHMQEGIKIPLGTASKGIGTLLLKL